MNVENLLSRVSEWLRRRVASIAKNERVATVTEVSVPAGKGKRQKGGKTLMVQAEEYLWSHYAFRYNVLSGEYEYARLATSKAAEEAPIYATLNAEVRRHLLMQLQREGINIPYIGQVQTIIECSRAEQYNPLLHYYGSLPTWDGTDHIGELFRRLTDDAILLGLLRRWICVELRGPIDTDTPICHTQLYAQALHLLDGGMQYWLSEAETRQLEEHNSAYMVSRGAEQLFVRHFAPIPYASDTPDEQLWPAVAVYDYLRRKDPRLMRHIERTTFAMYIRAQGITQVRRDNKRLFPLRVIES